MFHAGMALDLAVTAVVVGDEQSLGRNQFTRAAPSEEDHGVLERGLVDAVYVLGTQTEALGLHIGNPRGNEIRQPHSVVRHRTERHQGRDNRKEVFFHRFFECVFANINLSSHL